MFKRLFAGSAQKKIAHSLYTQLVNQARSAAFYQAPYDVPDTLEGRFELILLHLFIMDQSLANQGADNALRRILQETLVSDMDRTLREMGIGDVALMKQMKKVGAALLGRLQAYRNSVHSESAQEALSAALLRNVTENEDGATTMAAYVLRSLEALRQQNIVNANQMLTFAKIDNVQP